MTAFVVELELIVQGQRARRAAHFEHVTDAYARLEEKHDDLLDSSWGYTDQDDQGAVDVTLTVRGQRAPDVLRLAKSSVRSAIREAGGLTPDWENLAPAAEDAVVYRLMDEDAAVLAGARV